MPLRAVKGAPETYDRASIAHFLARVNELREITFPIYSREHHDPIQAGGRVLPHQQVVILEGNYWLLDELPWKEFQPFYDLRIFLKAEPDSLVSGLRERHLRGGKSAELAEAHLLRVDLPNIERVLRNSIPADVIIRKANSRQITGMKLMV